MIPDPLKEWYANPQNMADLENALRAPILKEAMAVLRHIALPKSNFTDRTSAEAITHAAMEQNRNAGFFSYPDDLWQLTAPPAKPPTAPQGYSDSYVKAWAKARGLWEEPKGNQDQEQEQQPT